MLLLLAGCERPLVQVTAARTGTVESTATSVEAGVVKARRDSTLSPPVSGRIVEIYQQEGDRVTALKPIVRLENDLEKIALEEAKVELERLRTLGPSGAAAQEALDRARFALERAQVNYERTFVRTPFDGILVELNANLGEMSYGTLPLNLVMGGRGAGGERPLARVLDDSQLYVEAYIDEADAGRLKPHQEARIAVDALGPEPIPGRLVWISPAISTSEGQSRTVRVEIEVDGAYSGDKGAAGSSRPALRAGMSADIEVILERVEGVVRVPTLVVLEGEAEKSVWVVEEGRLRRRAVKVGAANWELSEIKEGLRAGELVVIPADRRELVEGREVRVEEREEARRG